MSIRISTVEKRFNIQRSINIRISLLNATMGKCAVKTLMGAALLSGAPSARARREAAHILSSRVVCQYEHEQDNIRGKNYQPTYSSMSMIIGTEDARPI